MTLEPFEKMDDVEEPHVFLRVHRGVEPTPSSVRWQMFTNIQPRILSCSRPPPELPTLQVVVVRHQSKQDEAEVQALYHLSEKEEDWGRGWGNVARFYGVE